MESEQRLIDANKIKYRTIGAGGWNQPENVVSDYEIEKMPTVDAVEVVRCRDCKYRKKQVCANPSAGMWVGVELRENDYCSYGERKTDG